MIEILESLTESQIPSHLRCQQPKSEQLEQQLENLTRQYQQLKQELRGFHYYLFGN
ncbi:hypothetical protein [Coleofasciculus sp. F4-SAH-05]|uniref:hypothetical protein n=1 Tax=Coleofasciculus sp. F4-SAH-05 TaxID=3069525 RepID=UPI0032FECCA7